MTRLRRFSLVASVSQLTVLLVLALPATFAVLRAYEAAERHDHVVAEAVLDLVSAELLKIAEQRTVSAARAYLLTGDRDFLAETREVRLDFAARMRILHAGDVNQNALLESIGHAGAEYDAAVDRAVAVVDEGGAPASLELARMFERDVIPARRALREAVDAYVASRSAAIEPATRSADRAFRRALALPALAVVASILASAWLSWWAARTLARAFENEHDAVAAREELLALVAHDLRNPLGAISGNAGLIRATAGPDDADIVRRASTIERVSREMDQFIGTLLDAAAMEAGSFVVTPTPSEARALLDEVLSVFTGRAAAKSVRLSSKMDDPALVVLADRASIDRVLGNLVANAIKFTPPGGEVVVSAEPAGTTACFAVTDTGPGVSPRSAPRLFDRFWQAEPGRRRGSGLGLYIAKGIVEAHGGRIWVESEPLHGSTFRFTLPRAAHGA